MPVQGPPTGSAGIHLSGAINPAILHPLWLHTHGLINDQELAGAELEFAAPDFTRFEVRWFSLEARRTHLTISSTVAAESYQQLGEMAIAILETLPHTPITTVCMSRAVHHSLEEGRWDGLVSRLVNLDAWPPGLDSPRLGGISLRSTIVLDDERSGGTPTVGQRGVTLEPSVETTGGAHVLIEEEFDVSERELIGGARPAIGVLTGRWPALLAEAERLTAELLAKQ